MSTLPTPLEIATLGAANEAKMYGAINAANIAIWNKAIASYTAIYGTQPNSSAPPEPPPPMLTLVDQGLYIQLSQEADVPGSAWMKVLIQVQYVPVAPPPPTPTAALYTIGAANPYMPGFFAVSVSTNAHSDLADGIRIGPNNNANHDDAHQYVLHVYGFAGSVLAQMVQ